MRPWPFLLLSACVPAHRDAATVLSAVDEAWPKLQAQYRAEQAEATSWAESPAEAWDETGKVLDEWSPAWFATQATVEASERGADPVPPFCAARELWRLRGIDVDDRGLCVIQRPCWARPQDETK